MLFEFHPGRYYKSKGMLTITLFPKVNSLTGKILSEFRRSIIIMLFAFGNSLSNSQTNSMCLGETRAFYYALLSHFIILRLLPCMTYEREVTGSHSTRGKKVFILGISALGR